MYQYFGDSYAWDLAVLMALQMGGHVSEIDEACAPLKAVAASADPRADASLQTAWLTRWSALGDKLAEKAEADQAAGHPLSAAAKFRRAAVYYQQADRMAPHGDPAKERAYERMLETFAKAVRLAGVPLEWVEVPYDGTSLPALFLAGEGGGSRPCMIGFDGFDVTKEWTYLSGLAPELARRGVSVLMVDHPGIGLALRRRNMPTIVEMERPAGACVDLLDKRTDVRADRIGIMAMSLGGFYAPRAAAFEPRLAACVAWGARWDNAGSHGRILRDPDAARSIPGWIDHALKVYGQPDIAACAAMIDRMTLEGIADRIRCPLLVVHGAEDRQVPTEQARRTIEAAINSPRRDLRIFTAEEGGAAHVNGDNFSLAIDVIADWCADVLTA